MQLTHSPLSWLHERLLRCLPLDPRPLLLKVSNVLELEAGAAAEYGPHVGLQNFCFPVRAGWRALSRIGPR